MSKYKLNGTGIPPGMHIFISSITTNAPKTLPKSRILIESGRVTSSSRFMGSIAGIGSKNPFAHFFPPFSLKPATCISMDAITARATVTLMSFVGGTKPNKPIILENPMYIMNVSSIGRYFFPCGPRVSRKKSFIHVMPISSRHCFPCGTFFMLCVRIIESSTTTAMIIHDTAQESGTGMPPNMGIVNAVWFSSSSASFSERFSITSPFFHKKIKRKQPFISVSVGVFSCLLIYGNL